MFTLPLWQYLVFALCASVFVSLFFLGLGKLINWIRKLRKKPAIVYSPGRNWRILFLAIVIFVGAYFLYPTLVPHFSLLPFGKFAQKWAAFKWWGGNVSLALAPFFAFAVAGYDLVLRYITNKEVRNKFFDKVFVFLTGHPKKK